MDFYWLFIYYIFVFLWMFRVFLGLGFFYGVCLLEVWGGWSFFKNVIKGWVVMYEFRRGYILILFFN